MLKRNSLSQLHNKGMRRYSHDKDNFSSDYSENLNLCLEEYKNNIYDLDLINENEECMRELINYYNYIYKNYYENIVTFFENGNGEKPYANESYFLKFDLLNKQHVQALYNISILSISDKLRYYMLRGEVKRYRDISPEEEKLLFEQEKHNELKTGKKGLFPKETTVASGAPATMTSNGNINDYHNKMKYSEKEFNKPYNNLNDDVLSNSTEVPIKREEEFDLIKYLFYLIRCVEYSLSSENGNLASFYNSLKIYFFRDNVSENYYNYIYLLTLCLHCLEHVSSNIVTFDIKETEYESLYPSIYPINDRRGVGMGIGTVTRSSSGIGPGEGPGSVLNKMSSAQSSMRRKYSSTSFRNYPSTTSEYINGNSYVHANTLNSNASKNTSLFRAVPREYNSFRIYSNNSLYFYKLFFYLLNFLNFYLEDMIKDGSLLYSDMMKMHAENSVRRNRKEQLYVSSNTVNGNSSSMMPTLMDGKEELFFVGKTRVTYCNILLKSLSILNNLMNLDSVREQIMNTSDDLNELKIFLSKFYKYLNEFDDIEVYKNFYISIYKTYIFIFPEELEKENYFSPMLLFENIVNNSSIIRLRTIVDTLIFCFNDKKFVYFFEENINITKVLFIFITYCARLLANKQYELITTISFLFYIILIKFPNVAITIFHILNENNDYIIKYNEDKKFNSIFANINEHINMLFLSTIHKNKNLATITSLIFSKLIHLYAQFAVKKNALDSNVPSISSHHHQHHLNSSYSANGPTNTNAAASNTIQGKNIHPNATANPNLNSFHSRNFNGSYNLHTQNSRNNTAASEVTPASATYGNTNVSKHGHSSKNDNTNTNNNSNNVINLNYSYASNMEQEGSKQVKEEMFCKIFENIKISERNTVIKHILIHLHIIPDVYSSSSDRFPVEDNIEKTRYIIVVINFLFTLMKTNFYENIHENTFEYIDYFIEELKKSVAMKNIKLVCGYISLLLNYSLNKKTNNLNETADLKSSIFIKNIQYNNQPNIIKIHKALYESGALTFLIASLYESKDSLIIYNCIYSISFLLYKKSILDFDKNIELSNMKIAILNIVRNYYNLDSYLENYTENFIDYKGFLKGTSKKLGSAVTAATAHSAHDEDGTYSTTATGIGMMGLGSGSGGAAGVGAVHKGGRHRKSLHEFEDAVNRKYMYEEDKFLMNNDKNGVVVVGGGGGGGDYLSNRMNTNYLTQAYTKNLGSGVVGFGLNDHTMLTNNAPSYLSAGAGAGGGGGGSSFALKFQYATANYENSVFLNFDKIFFETIKNKKSSFNFYFDTIYNTQYLFNFLLHNFLFYSKDADEYSKKYLLNILLHNNITRSSDISFYSNKIKNLNSQFNESQSRLEIYKQDLERYKDVINVLNKEIEEKQNAHNVLIQKIRKENEIEMNRKTQENNNLENIISQKNEIIDELQRKYEEVYLQKKEAEEENVNIKNRTVSMESILKSLQNKYTQIQSQNKILNSKLTEQTNQINEGINVINSLTNENEKLKTIEENQNNELEGTFKKLIVVVKELSENRRELDEKDKKIKAYDADIQELKNRINNDDNELKEQAMIIENMSGLNKNLNEELNTANKNLEVSKRYIMNYEKNEEEMKVRIMKLEKELFEKNEECEMKTQKLLLKEKELSDKEIQLKKIASVIIS